MSRNVEFVKHSQSVAEVVDAVAAHDIATLARAISLIERGDSSAWDLDREVATRRVTCPVVGTTGAPGAGKSTLVDAFISEIRRANQTVAVLAVDPSSPYTGGAILGDRVRMQSHVLDNGVFVRSLANRGQLGGLSAATSSAIRLCELAGFDWVIVETVGIGQVEIAIADAADLTLVVVNPDSGDGIQANKAGLFEVGDIFIINKADRAGADQTQRDLEAMLMMSSGVSAQRSILRTNALDRSGVSEAWQAIRAALLTRQATGEFDARRHANRRSEACALANESLQREVDNAVRSADAEAIFALLALGVIDAREASQRIVALIHSI